MRTSNPTLSESAFNRLGASQGQTGYGSTATQPGTMPPDPFGHGAPPAAPAVSRADRFTVEGAIYKTGFLLVLLVLSGLASAALLPESLYMPAIIASVVVGLGLVIGISIKPDLAKTLAPVYALVEGVVLGAITVMLESQPGLEGIGAQAALGTVAVLAVMLTLYRTGVIKVTQRFRMIVTAATGAIFVTYLLSFVLGFFGINFGFLHGNSMLSIGISLLIIGVAAANLALDFDFIETAAARGLPAKAEWYAAFGLLVTLVWIYLEILRLLAKLNSRD